MREPKAVWSGEFSFSGLTMKCHVLDTGQRIIEEESVKAFLKWMKDGKCLDPADPGLRDFAKWQAGATAIGADGRLIDRDG